MPTGAFCAIVCASTSGPRCSAAFPQAEGALAASAGWAREAQQCAEELAAIDGARIVDAQGLDIAGWSGLSPARRSNVLRAWVKAQTGTSVAAATIQRLLTELPARSPAQWLVDGFVLRRYRGHLSCRAETPLQNDPPRPVKTATFGLMRAGTFAMPAWGGRLCVQRVATGGVPMSMLSELRLVERRGGEKFQRAAGTPARSLKKQFQSNAVPAWERGGPLLYRGEQLIYVPGLGIDARALADRGVRQARLVWLPDDC